jgi:hypothetical protein
MDFNYPDLIGSLSPDGRLHFYELLAHNLTISIRGAWSDPELNESVKLERIYLINEILHRVTAKVFTLRLGLHEWTEADSWSLIKSCIDEDRAIEKDVLFAIRCSYDYVVKTDSGNNPAEGMQDQ